MQITIFAKNYCIVRKILAVIFIVIFFTQIKAQVNVSDSTISAFIPHIAYAIQAPGGDVADRYGYNSTIGGGFMYKTKKNLLFSADVNFIFGNQIKNADSILWIVLTKNGYIIDGNGTYANYAIFQRGYSINFRVGKILKVLRANPNSGLMLMGGAGYLLHRMRIDVQHETVQQLKDDYGKGYDRLTGGLNLNEFIGYFYMGRTRVLNFYAGFEFYQAFTKNLRDRDFDQLIYDQATDTYTVAGKDNNNYVDLFFGIKIGWMIPIYNRAPDTYYYH